MEKMFPLQAGYRDAKSAPHPLQIPWSVAEKAYCAYARRYGTRQSLERLAERGGFDGAEMDMLYPPWREESAELTTLRQRAEAAEASRDTARGVANAFRDTIERATGNHDAVHGLMILCESHEKLQAAERRVRELEGAVRVLAEECVDMREREPVGHSTNPGIISCRIAVNQNPHAKAAIDAAGGEG